MVQCLYCRREIEECKQDPCSFKKSQNHDNAVIASKDEAIKQLKAIIEPIAELKEKHSKDRLEWQSAYEKQLEENSSLKARLLEYENMLKINSKDK